MTKQIGETTSNETLTEWLSQHMEYAVVDGEQKTAGDIQEVSRIGTGLMLIQRSALRKLMAEANLTEYKPDGEVAWLGRDTFSGFFDHVQVDGKFVGEDYAFCERWRGIGGKIYALVSEEIGHVGEFVMRGRYADRVAPQGDPS